MKINRRQFLAGSTALAAAATIAPSAIAASGPRVRFDGSSDYLKSAGPFGRPYSCTVWTGNKDYFCEYQGFDRPLTEEEWASLRRYIANRYGDTVMIETAGFPA